MSKISRRNFIKTASAAAAGAVLATPEATAMQSLLGTRHNSKKLAPASGTVYNYSGSNGVQRLQIWSPAIKEPVHLFVISDTHLWESDARNEPYAKFSARMHAAYNSVPHYRTHQPTTPAASFKETMAIAKESQPDAIVHLGDLVSYPSEYSIEYAESVIKETGLPFYYISGNHDWCYEGYESDPFKHRDTWMPRLKPLYPEGADPLMYTKEVKGVKLILIDDSVDNVTPDQIEFFRKEVSTGAPSLLMMHIGLYLPGHDTFYMGYPAYTPKYHYGKGLEMVSASGDGSHADNIERFFDEVMLATDKSQLLATIAGHNHIMKSEEIGLHRQFVVPFNGDGSYTDLYLLPAEE